MNDANNGLQNVLRDAQSAATLQKISKAGAGLAGAGVIGAGATLSLPISILSAVGLLWHSGGSISAGRELLNYVATHPKLLTGYEAAAKVANSPVAKGAARVTGIGAGKAAGSVFSGLKGQLAGTDQQQ